MFFPFPWGQKKKFFLQVMHIFPKIQHQKSPLNYTEPILCIYPIFSFHNVTFATCIKLWDKFKWLARSFNSMCIRINWDKVTIKLATFYTVVVMAHFNVLLQLSSIYGESTIRHPKVASNLATFRNCFLPTVGYSVTENPSGSTWAGPAFAHGTTGEKRTVGAPPYIKICKKKRRFARLWQQRVYWTNGGYIVRLDV
jgi:hypothetical protein